MTKFTEEQKDRLFGLAAIEAAHFESRINSAAKSADKTLDEFTQMYVGCTWQELVEIMPVWRKAYINASFEARRRMDAGTEAAQIANIPWQTLFRLTESLQDGDLVEYIKGILPEGVTFLGALSGVGKTWFALSLAHALVTGEKLFSIHDVFEPCNVLYLSPEVGDRAFRKRLVKLKLFGHPRFRCQTQMDGVLSLSSPSLEAYCREMQPVIFLDTAIRFNPAADENSASQNAKLLAQDIFKLRKWGAKAVVCLHHSPKYKKKDNWMTLENTLRGSGDIGAMCDAVWGIEHDRRKLNKKDWDEEYEQESERMTRLLVRCVKPRDFEPVEPFRIQGRPFIDSIGSFAVLTEEQKTPVAMVNEVIALSPDIDATKLRKKLGMGYARFCKLAEEAQWKWEETRWIRLKQAFEKGASAVAVESEGNI